MSKRGPGADGVALPPAREAFHREIESWPTRQAALARELLRALLEQDADAATRAMAELEVQYCARVGQVAQDIMVQQNPGDVDETVATTVPDPVIERLGTWWDSLSPWWHARSRFFRAWCLCSVIWATFVCAFVWALDPFGNGSWEYMDAGEYRRMFFVMLAPPLTVGTLVYGFRKYVR